MIRALGFAQGLRGDLVMNTVCARAFKQLYPDAHLTLGINQKFKDLLPLFLESSFDSYHVYQAYDGWPGPQDQAYLAAARYDIVFPAMPQHRDNWWEHRHQYAETAFMNGLPIPTDIRPHLTRWFDVPSLGPTIAIAPFGGNGGVNDKMLTVEQARAIVDWLNQMGHPVVHLGARGEPDIGAPRPDLPYFDAVRTMLGCRMLIHCDTGMGHVAGAYNHLSFGIYGWRYHGQAGLKHIQPLHPNFHHTDGPHVDKIPVEQIIEGLKGALYS